METLTIKKAVDIKASPMKVWNVLTEDGHVRKWYNEFSKGAYAETDWQEGSKVIFRDGSDWGMISEVKTSKPGKELDTEMIGVIEKGVEIYDGPKADEVRGGRETYVLTEENGITHLDIKADMSKEYYDMMSKAWDRALEVVKTLAEQ